MKCYHLRPAAESNQEAFQRRTGFSILEFFSAVTVLGIVMSLILPVFYESLEAACMAEQQAMRTAIRADLMEFYSTHGHFPVSLGEGAVVGAYWNDLTLAELDYRHINPRDFRYECRDGRTFRLIGVDI